jgi:hypothetical protein
LPIPAGRLTSDGGADQDKHHTQPGRFDSHE